MAPRLRRRRSLKLIFGKLMASSESPLRRMRSELTRVLS